MNITRNNAYVHSWCHMLVMTQHLAFQQRSPKPFLIDVGCEDGHEVGQRPELKQKILSLAEFKKRNGNRVEIKSA